MFVRSASGVDRAFPEFASPAQKAILNSVSKRVYSGDVNAMREAAKLPPAVALPYLYVWTDSSNTSQGKDAAVAALRDVQGYADYLKLDIAKGIAQGGVPGDDFEILGLIATPEAAAVAAPYLFDAKIYIEDNDGTWDNACGAAILALISMNLPGAPKGTSPVPGYWNSAVLVEWQKWAIEKGYVPKDWISRVGAPAWLLGEEANERINPKFAGTKSPQPVQPASSPSPAGAGSPIPTNPPSPVAAPLSKVSGHAAGLMIAAGLLVLLIIGGIIVWKKRP